ncbi:NHLP bacteriocin export ABC transporter permease/ATPase subunit [Kitasatospora nipponensis]|uniref:NHLP bacteriocin export ABC transporter permease/ATPase subunit n=1 Tax=Kitasatospora nipponensis TaxID=258049 RepID=A0ABN1T7N2_9ACTN
MDTTTTRTAATPDAPDATPVPAAAPRSTVLDGPGTLWTVVRGAADLFAQRHPEAGGPGDDDAGRDDAGTTDTEPPGRLHHVCRLPAGHALLGDHAAAGYRLVLQTLPGAELTARAVPADASPTDAAPAAPALRAGLAAVRAALAPATGESPAEHDPAPRAEADTLAQAYAEQRRLLAGLGRDLERAEERAARRRSERHAARRKAQAGADRSLRTLRPTGAAAPAEPYLATVRLIGRAAGFTVPDAAEGYGDDLDRIADAAQLRRRQVRLGGRWWTADLGPLLVHRRTGAGEPVGRPVALLRRRGGYRLVDPLGGTGRRCTPAVAEGLEGTGITFTSALPAAPAGVVRLLRHGVRGSGADLAMLVLGSLAVALLGLLTPIATGRILGVLVPAGRSDLVLRLGVLLIAAATLSAVLQLSQSLAALRLAGRWEGRLQAAVWDRLLRLPVRFFAARRSGELAEAALGLSAAGEILAGAVVMGVQSLLVGTVYAALMLHYSVRLGLLGLGLAGGAFAVCLPLVVLQMRRQRELWRVGVTLSDLLVRLLNGLPKLRVAAAEEFAFQHWAERFVRARRLKVRLRRLQNAVTVFNAGFTPLSVLVVFAAVSGGPGARVSTGAFLAFYVAFGTVLGCAYQLIGAVASTLAAAPLLAEVKPALAEPVEHDPRRVDPGRLSGRLEVASLAFGYGAGPPALSDVSFTVEPGESLAVVGATGCGKSTLLRLLIGFEDPAHGVVRYDGRDLATLDPAAVRRQCGVVLQDGQLFSGSILSNICGNSGHTLEDAWRAVRVAALEQDVAALPMGLDTVLQDGAATLSAGQRQRVLIARAVVGEPRILLLDEATSALDNATQAAVTRNLQELRATRVLIAHRLSTVLQADRVLVLEHGRVAQLGPPAELLADRQGLFHRLNRRRPAG